MDECEGCGARLRGGRRYSFEPLAESMRMTQHQTCKALNISGDSYVKHRCHGMTRLVADRMASRAGLHPFSIWPEMVDHDFEDTSKPCKECGERFVPGRKDQLYCGKRCLNRVSSRNYARKKYATDPVWVAQRRAYWSQYYQDTRSYALASQRRRDAARAEERREYMREYRARKKEQAA